MPDPPQENTQKLHPMKPPQEKVSLSSTTRTVGKAALGTGGAIAGSAYGGLSSIGLSYLSESNPLLGLSLGVMNLSAQSTFTTLTGMMMVSSATKALVGDGVLSTVAELTHTVATIGTVAYCATKGAEMGWGIVD